MRIELPEVYIITGVDVRGRILAGPMLQEREEKIHMQVHTTGMLHALRVNTVEGKYFYSWIPWGMSQAVFSVDYINVDVPLQLELE